MLLKSITYSLLLFLFFLPVYISAQGIGAPIINITFGEGDINPGPPLPKNNTGFNYTADSCPAPGYYTITNSLYRCPATRIGRSIDHTPLSSSGYMMLVNDTASETSKMLYIDTLKASLCPGSLYQFSAYFLNVEIPTYCNSPNIHLPAFTFNIETTSGQVLKSGNTGPISFGYNLSMVPQFIFFGVDFIMPAGISSLVLKIKDDLSGFTPCGYSFALDDIQFSAAGPRAHIAFNDGVGTDLVKSVCFQDNESISFSGSLDPGFTNPAVQWQQSIDSGATWTDIPGATNYAYFKNFSIIDTFLFRLRASEADKIGNPNCSVVSNTLKVEVDGPPPTDSVTSNSPVCAGQDLIFSAAGGASYVWSGPNGFYDNVPYAHIYHSVLADSGTYYVQIKSFGGCVATGSTHVTMIGTDVTLGPSQSICKGQSVQLSAAGGSNYLWSPAAGLSSTTIVNPKATPDVTTTYSVTVTDQFGCSNSGSVIIKLLNDVAVKAVISSPNFLCRPYDSASFKDMSLGAIKSWHWDFGNGLASIQQNPPVQDYSIAENTADYTVRLAIADTTGCADTAYHVMKVENNCYIAVPSAFTPNGDGLNDYLYPLNAYKATQLLFRVFNREGQMVFETRDWTKKWDGTFKGNPLTTDVFVWELSYTDVSGKRIFLKGSTLLIR